MEYWVVGTEQAYWGSYFILVAAVFDVLDGLTARGLKIFSPLGKDLDSLADIVSFGVAPSMILFKFLWAALMSEQGALDVSMLALAPAFLPVCAGALRLARYNVSGGLMKNSFTGMPIPAAGIFIASFPLISWYTPELGIYLQNKWVLYTVIVIISWLMVSRISFFKLAPSKWSPKENWAQIILLLALVIGIILIQFAIIPVIFILYVLLAFIYKAKED